jgi:hypothetical protein
MTTATSFWNRLAGIAVIAFVIAVSSTARLYAQGFAKIVGTVTDPSGAVIPSATVSATQTNTGTVIATVKTGGDGAYVFPALLPTNYSLTVIATGFEKYTQAGIVLEANQSATVNIKLVVGSSAVTVSVIGDAPQIDTTSGTLSQVIDEARVVDLPVNSRNAAVFMNLVAGVVDATNEGNGTNQGNGKTFPAAVVSSTNGTLPAQQNFLLDGGNNVDEMTNTNGPFPFPDALQEFSVQTSNYNAEFGQSAGGVVNIIIKSGTNKFHGDGFEFLRNGFFNAKNYFSSTYDTLHRHYYGGTIGGPVIIPFISKGHSTQFFFGYQHQLYHQGSSSSSATFPTAAEEGTTGTGYADYSNLCAGTSTVSSNTYGLAFGTSGALTGLCTYATGTGPLTGTFAQSGQITNPFTGVNYANNHIPTTNFDAAAVNFEKDLPVAAADAGAGKIGGVVNYFKPTDQSFDEYVARVDHQFGDKDHLFGHYYYNYFIQQGIYNPTMLASYSSYFNTRYQNALLSETHTFTSNLLNNVIANYQREVALRGGPPGSPDVTAFGVNNLWQPNTGPYMSVTISNYVTVSSSAYAGWFRNNYTFNDDLHWVKGKHNFAFGGHVEISKFDVNNIYQSYGGFTSGTTTTFPNAMANFQQGFLTGFTQGNFELLKDRNHFPGIYAQDSWKLTPRLTMDYGVRWEDFAPWANKNGVQTAFSPANYAAGTQTPQYSTLPAGMVLSGDPLMPNANGLNNKYAQFMPRAGFSYDVFGTGKTVVRGGGGIFYQDRMPGFFNLSQSSNVPNTISVALTNLGLNGVAKTGGPFSNPYGTGTATAYPNPFPFTLPFPKTQTFPNGFVLQEFDPSENFQVPVTYDYNLTIEHQVATGWVARVAYVGSKSRHQFVNLEINPTVNFGTSTNNAMGTNPRRVYNTSPTVGPCTSATVGPLGGSTACAQNYGQMVVASMSGASRFHSMQTSLEKKMAHNFSLLVNFTWSKSLDDMPQATRVSNTEDLNAGESYVYPLYPSNAVGVPAAAIVSDIKALDRGRSDIDKPFALSVSYVYHLPELHEGNSAVKYVLNGWLTSGLFQHHSGDSLTTYMSSDQSGTGLSQDRSQRDFTKPAYSKQANGAGNCSPTTAHCVNWFNNAAFSTPANTGAGTGFGNVVKGSLRGPGYTNWDAAVLRTFPVYRQANIQFRAEYYDVLNHTELGNPNTTQTSTSFGTITGGASNRIAQFALKVIF